MKEDYVIMTRKTYESIMSYLSNRPYSEVGGSIPAIEREVAGITATSMVVAKEYTDETIDEIHLHKEEEND